MEDDDDTVCGRKVEDDSVGVLALEDDNKCRAEVENDSVVVLTGEDNKDCCSSFLAQTPVL